MDVNPGPNSTKSKNLSVTSVYVPDPLRVFWENQGETGGSKRRVIRFPSERSEHGFGTNDAFVSFVCKQLVRLMTPMSTLEEMVAVWNPKECRGHGHTPPLWDIIVTKWREVLAGKDAPEDEQLSKRCKERIKQVRRSCSICPMHLSISQLLISTFCNCRCSIPIGIELKHKQLPQATSQKETLVRFPNRNARPVLV